MRKPDDLSDLKFGKLRALNRIRSITNARGWKLYYWRCICSCGQYKDVRSDMLRKGRVTSCGCNRREHMKRIQKAFRSSSRRLILKLTCNYCKKKFCKWRKNKEGNVYCSTNCYHASTKGHRFQSYLAFIRNNNCRRRRKKAVKITVKDLELQWNRQKGRCPYTGHELILLNGKKHEKLPMQASIDRIDNNKDYVKGNVQFVALIANYAKNEFTELQLLEFCHAVSTYRKFSKTTRAAHLHIVPKS